jgi:hypothetical protein
MTDHPPVACCPSRSHTGHHVSQGTRFRAKKKWVITSLLAAYCVVSFKCPYLRRKAVCIQLGHDCRVDVVGLDQCFGNQPDLERVGNNDLTCVRPKHVHDHGSIAIHFQQDTIVGSELDSKSLGFIAA